MNDVHLRIEDGSVRRQLSKACKKIYKVFRGVLDTADKDECDEDYSAIGFKNVSSFIFSEVQLHQTLISQLVNCQ